MWHYSLRRSCLSWNLEALQTPWTTPLQRPWSSRSVGSEKRVDALMYFCWPGFSQLVLECSWWSRFLVFFLMEFYSTPGSETIILKTKQDVFEIHLFKRWTIEGLICNYYKRFNIDWWMHQWKWWKLLNKMVCKFFLFCSNIVYSFI